MADLDTFLLKTYQGVTARWDVALVTEASHLDAPGGSLHGTYSWLVTGDIYILWARWFAEGVVDPDRYLEVENPYPLVLDLVSNHIPNVLPQHPMPEREALAAKVAGMIVEEIQRRAGAPGRRAWTKTEKQELWDLGAPHQRCWMCGYQFSAAAGERFLGEGNTPDPLPTWIDFLRPRGIGMHDLRVEIDHVGALAAGGDEEQLRLSCGWCNRHKRDRSSLYDTAGPLRWFEHTTLGRVGIPHTFWVVRALAMRRTCEHREGCDRSTDTAEMTIAPIRPAGAPNPANLRVTCLDHDPLAGGRLFQRDDYATRLH